MAAPRAERPAMKDYGVPDEPNGLLPWSWAEERLVRNRNYWVVTASANGRPHSLPVWGVWLPESSSFAFSCAPGSRKARNMHVNPQVAFTADNTVECISVEGRARILAADLVDPVAEQYATKYEPDPDKRAELATFVKSHEVWEIVPQRAFGIIEREEDFARRATRWVWG
jgi:nitroimidazol reductase NimA-like FMN-containing flavoprotein (pyridoxamine 5'-phosphate oxidase superfamily)